MSNQNKLFDEFPTISSKQWKQKIQLDLKGADYNKTLLTHTLEGITIKPFYHVDHYKKLDIPENNREFQICQTIFISNDKTANFLAKDALKRGANNIQFIADKIFDPGVVLKDLSLCNLFFQFSFLDLNFLQKLITVNQNQSIYLNVDLIGNLSKTGNWFFNKQKDHEILRKILDFKNNKVHVLGVDAALYQNAGANTVQQVAYAMAHANEYLIYLQKNKINTAKKINFNFSIGSNYFFEIAKLRAFRYLWHLLLKKCDFQIEANIFTQPTLRNKSILDHHVNMLRTTTESLSAILGGSNTISNVSYDTLFHKKNEFGERIARNQLLILKEESHIKNANLANGSFYIEELTFEIAEKALQIFKDIEKKGGFVKQLYNGTIQRKINENAQKEQNLFDSNDLVLVGANKFPNLKNITKEEIDIYPFLKTNKKQTEIQPIIPKRLAEKVEKEHFNKH